MALSADSLRVGETGESILGLYHAETEPLCNRSGIKSPPDQRGVAGRPSANQSNRAVT